MWFKKLYENEQIQHCLHFFRFDFGPISILILFSKYDFHKVHMYAIHIVIVMKAGVECKWSNTNALESQGKYIHEQTINNQQDSL